jgi:hypothetical protein
MQESQYKGMFASSPDWVTAVTYTKISESVFGTVAMSIGLASAVVFVFCGPLMMLFAAVTVLMMNLTVMGVLYLWDWCAISTCMHGMHACVALTKRLALVRA